MLTEKENPAMVAPSCNWTVWLLLQAELPDGRS